MDQNANISLSIIIPVFNGEKYIVQLMEMFSKQAKLKYELVIIDDGSVDDTERLVINNADKYEYRINYIKQANAGVSAARNRGIAASMGKYLSFVDVDDYVSTDYIGELFHYMSNKDTPAFDIAYFRQQKLNENESILQTTVDTMPALMNKLDLLNRFLMNPTDMGVYNFLYRKEWLMNTAIQFQTGFKYYEDYDFIVRALALAGNIVYTDKVLYYYVQRSDSVMRQFSYERIRCLELMDKLEEWLSTVLPEFYVYFKRWGASRIYWSVLWQACISLKNRKTIKKFADKTNARDRLKKLLSYPNLKIRFSSAVFLLWPSLYIEAIKTIANKKFSYPYSVSDDLKDFLES